MNTLATSAVIADMASLAGSGANPNITSVTASGTIQFGSLSDGTITITDIADEDNMSSNSAVKLATQQSIKAYVDANAGLSLIDEDNMATDSATRPPSQQSVKAYVDATTTIANAALPKAGGTMTGALTVQESVTFESSGSSKPVLTVKNTNADTTPPSITFQKDSASPADNDEIANINFYGDDDGGNVAAYANLKVIAPDVSDGSEDGKMTIRTMKAGTLTDTLVLESGTTTVSETLALSDNVKALFGTGSDLEIFHDGSNSKIVDAGTGDLLIAADNNITFTNAAVSENKAIFTTNGAVTLYYDNSAKFVTTATGIAVTGTAVATTDTDTSNTGNVTLDFAANQNFVLTLTGNTTLVNPSTEQVGQSGFITLIQDGTGGRTLSLGTDYETAGGAGITLTSTASATDIVPYVVAAAGRILLGAPQLAFS